MRGAAEHALRDALGEAVDRRDAIDVNRELVALDDFEFGMIDVELPDSLLRLAEDDEALAGRDHFLHMPDIEPAQDEPRAERGGAFFFQRDLDHCAASADAFHRELLHDAA